MKKFTGLFVTLALAALLTLSLAACGKSFKCDYCNQEKTGKQHKAQFLGQEMIICDDCYEAMNDLGKQLRMK